MSHGLSKTKILHGLQCPKRLWLEVHQPELAQYSEVSAQLIQAGNEFHRAYRELVPDGILVEHVDDLNAALEQTRLIMSESAGAPVFEGAFQHKGVLVRADLLFLASSGSRLVEVKAAGSVKDHHIQDCGIQTWVIQGAGIPVKAIELAVINTSFVYPGGGDYRGLFRHEDVAESVRILMPQVAGWVRECRKVVESAKPVVGVGDQCRAPYACPFLEHCSVGEPAYPVMCLPYGRNVAEDLMAEGIFDIRDIPEGKLSNSTHERVHRVTKSRKAEVDPSVVAVLNQFPYPRYYLDFETIAFAVPRWAGTRPYQPIPFQWSCHVEHADGRLEHKWFLDTSGECPLTGVAENLVNDLGSTGPIFMYGPYEKRIINDLTGPLPDLFPKLKPIVDRLVDLYPLVKEHYYHPDMKGSWSLKSVTACIAPEISHANLEEVADGMAAQRGYLEIIMPETDEVRRESLRKKLFDYCKLDTMAMVSITRLLQGL